MSSTLILYKRILRAAHSFPSIKKNKIIEEIRLGFRENRTMEGEALRAQLAVAEKGLSQLEQYTGLSRNSPNWSVSMENNPLPDNRSPEPEERGRGNDFRSVKTSDRIR